MYQEQESTVRVGDVLAAKYRVDRMLGAGGMGVVVAATHLQLDQVVAIKLVRSEVLNNPEIVARFEREARVAVRLKSEHAARIIDVGRLESGSPYIVMEYLEGQDLAQLLEQRRTLPVAVACDYVTQACDAIAEAHSLGIVHRDLKPGNLFLARTSHDQQVIKVLDFGISKTHLPVGDVNMTRTQAVMGSPGYMSPEQMRSTKNVDGRTDIWSLGVILYELVAGRTPFQGDTFSALCVKIAVDAHPPMFELPSKLPPGFEAVVNHALQKDPAMRYRSAAELAQALAPYAGASARERAQRLVAANPVAMPSAAHQVMLGPHANTIDAASGQALGSARGPRSLARRPVIAGAGIAAAAAIGLAIGITRIGAGASRSDDAREDPGAALHREPPRATGQPAPTPGQPAPTPTQPAPTPAQPAPTQAHVPPDAGAVAPAITGPAPMGGPPPQATPPGQPSAARAEDAGVQVPAVPPVATPGKSRSKPATLDPYSSPD
jgi:serine/threonine-protein kinase